MLRFNRYSNIFIPSCSHFLDCHPYALHFYSQLPLLPLGKSQSGIWLPLPFLFANRRVAQRTQCPQLFLPLSLSLYLASSSPLFTASFVLLVDIPMEFQFPATAAGCKLRFDFLLRKKVCYDFARLALVSVWVCDNWYAICAVFLKLYDRKK